MNCCSFGNRIDMFIWLVIREKNQLMCYDSRYWREDPKLYREMEEPIDQGAVSVDHFFADDLEKIV